MKKFSLKKSDLLIALTATALSASILACGQPRNPNMPVGTVPGASSSQPVTPPPSNPQGLKDISQFPAAHMNAISGTYQGHIVAMDEYYNAQDIGYTLVLMPNTAPGASGRQFQVSYQAGNQRLSAFTQTTQSAGFGGNTRYTITSYPQNVPAIYQYAPVMLQLQLEVNSNNVLDPTSSTIRIAEGVFFQNVVDFEYDLEKR